MNTPPVRVSSRRAVLAGAGVACAAALAGCARYDANNGGIAGGAPAPSSAPASSGNTSSPASGAAHTPH